MLIRFDVGRVVGLTRGPGRDGKSHRHPPPTRLLLRSSAYSPPFLSPYYPTGVVIGLGVALTIAGISLSIFGSVAFLVDASMASLGAGIWVGALVTCSGLIAITSGARPVSSSRLYLFLFSSMFTVSVAGFLAILTLTTVIRDGKSPMDSDPYSAAAVAATGATSVQNISSDSDEVLITKATSATSSPAMSHSAQSSSSTKSSSNNTNNPAIMVNTLLLIFSSLATIISLVNFIISGRETCQCYSYKTILGTSYDPRDPFKGVLPGVDTVWKRDRIVEWLVQQSEVVNTGGVGPHTSNTCSTCDSPQLILSASRLSRDKRCNLRAKSCSLEELDRPNRKRSTQRKLTKAGRRMSASRGDLADSSAYGGSNDQVNTMESCHFSHFNSNSHLNKIINNNNNHLHHSPKFKNVRRARDPSSTQYASATLMKSPSRKSSTTSHHTATHSLGQQHAQGHQLGLEASSRSASSTRFSAL